MVACDPEGTTHSPRGSWYMCAAGENVCLCWALKLWIQGCSWLPFLMCGACLYVCLSAERNPMETQKEMKSRCEGEKERERRREEAWSPWDRHGALVSTVFSICKLIPVSFPATRTNKFMFCKSYLTQASVPQNKTWLTATATRVLWKPRCVQASDVPSTGLSPASPPPFGEGEFSHRLPSISSQLPSNTGFDYHEVIYSLGLS